MLGASSVLGQNYPNRPVRIVTAAVGGSGDILARLIGHALTPNLGQQVIVDNRGGLGDIAAQIVAKAPPDGYTLLIYASIIWLAPYLRDNVTWDPVRDYAPITLATASPNVLLVHPSLPVKSVRELIALAKARPGQLNYSTGGSGSSNHLAMELFKSMTNTDIVRILYKGTGPAVNAAIAGEVQVLFSTPAIVEGPVKAGRLRALAVTSPQPSRLFPGLPTVAASGVPGYESQSIFGIWTPAKTPAPIIERLNQEIIRVLNEADVKEKLFAAGVEPVGSTPDQFLAVMKSEMTRMGKVIKDANIHE
jgi:tripartite-type tricarboxylate transporter receptor subunit TctC